jgi:hypothetical protein
MVGRSYQKILFGPLLQTSDGNELFGSIVKNSVISSKKLEPERCGNKINPFILTLHLLDETMSWRHFNSVLARKRLSILINTPFGVSKDISSSLGIYCELGIFFFFSTSDCLPAHDRLGPSCL